MICLCPRESARLLGTVAGRIKLYLSLCLLIVAPVSMAAPPSFDQYSVLSALTLNFARFTQWPEAAFLTDGNKLRVCLVGDNQVQQAFDGISDKNVADKTIEIVNANRLRNLDACHILFISELPKNLQVQVFIDVKGHPVLTIGENEEFVESGGMVGMINVDGKIKLYINLPAVRGAGLMISSNLLRLSRIFGENIH